MESPGVQLCGSKTAIRHKDRANRAHNVSDGFISVGSDSCHGTLPYSSRSSHIHAMLAQLAFRLLHFILTLGSRSISNSFLSESNRLTIVRTCRRWCGIWRYVASDVILTVICYRLSTFLPNEFLRELPVMHFFGNNPPSIALLKHYVMITWPSTFIAQSMKFLRYKWRDSKEVLI